MSHLPFTLLAYGLNALSVTVDKILLTKNVPNPLIYVFYFSLVSLIVIVLVPFTQIPSLQVFALASLSTLLWSLGAYFMFKAMQIGLVSRVVPVIGTLIPLLLLFQAFFNQTINPNQATAVLLLVLGLIFLTIQDWQGSLSKKELAFIILSTAFFASSYVFLRQAYLLQNHFITVFVWSRFILIPVGILLLAIPPSRTIILNKQGQKLNLNKNFLILFIIGQFCGGFAELLLTFSVSLAEPALVNSLQGAQYGLIFILTLALSKKYPEVFKESIYKKTILSKITGIILIAIGLYILALNS